ncbi:unnamed protein product [Acanthosepion pharaonis]|uniref:Uncharacterized protein n=1 Tax=Acanthosepion pharaonis TaxID=158019 RepID=A0A812CLZ4_ACAPH|nr:unnamed protein product [Sepia pharaonis]
MIKIASFAFLLSFHLPFSSNFFFITPTFLYSFSPLILLFLSLPHFLSCFSLQLFNSFSLSPSLSFLHFLFIIISLSQFLICISFSHNLHSFILCLSTPPLPPPTFFSFLLFILFSFFLLLFSFLFILIFLLSSLIFAFLCFLSIFPLLSLFCFLFFHIPLTSFFLSFFLSFLTSLPLFLFLPFFLCLSLSSFLNELQQRLPNDIPHHHS